MLSKNQAKIIQSLRLKKFRQKYNLFVAEGLKMLETILLSDRYKIKTLYHTKHLPQYMHNHHEITQVTIDERMMKSISFLNNPSDILILVETLRHDPTQVSRGIYLDAVQDPGNVGTIIRIADWFGYDSVIRSPDTADFYNPKVVQSTMGAFANVQLLERSRDEIISTQNALLVAHMEGSPIQDLSPFDNHILIVGNEGQGVSPVFSNNPDITKVKIQGNKDRISDSLNVSVATGIICSQLRK